MGKNEPVDAPSIEPIILDALNRLGFQLDQIIGLMTARVKANAAPAQVFADSCQECGISGAHMASCSGYVDPVLKRAPCTSCGSLFAHLPGCENIVLTPKSELTREPGV